MTAVYFDSDIEDDERRQSVYSGALFVYSPTPGSSELCEFARQMAVEAFDPYDPRDAQHSMDVDEYAAILADLKPTFIHHPRCKELIPAILSELRCNLERTFFDVPRLRTSTSDGYLTSGMAYAFKPHRDTWYSTPLCQINWWLPIYPLEPTSAMAFHTKYWNRSLKNSSREFNYQNWQVTGRSDAPKVIGKDTRRQSEAEEPVELEPDLRLVPEPGSIIVFSAAHMHSSVPNTSGRTRLSVDFRTVHLDELRDNSGAPNRDSASTGTTIDDYLRGTNLDHVPADIAATYKEN